MFNVINGGRHAENSTDFQEFMVVPIGFDTFREALRAGVEVYRALEDLLRTRKASTTLGDEGGFAPPLSSNREAVDLTLAAIEGAGYLPGVQCFLALDVAASELVLEDGRYSLLREGTILQPGQLIERYEQWIADYPIISIEDGMAEEDWDGWRRMTQSLGDRVQLVGDDLYATNTELSRKGTESSASNAVLIKTNQIGTLTETLNAVRLSREAGWNVVISHRSGETTDDFISDLAVATAAGQIKAGAPARGERTAKYNRLLRIEEELGGAAVYAGRDAYRRFIDRR
jgi:enolase